MTQNITAQQCKQELENILKNAVENGNFKYVVHVDGRHFTLDEDKEIEVVIKGRANETKEIYVDYEYTALDTEEVRVCKVKRNEFLEWGYDKTFDDFPKSSVTFGLRRYSEINFITTQLLHFQRLSFAKRFTLEQSAQMFGNSYYPLELDIHFLYNKPEQGQEVYVWGKLGEAKVLSNPASLALEIYRDNRKSEVRNCYYFKTTYGELKKAFKNQ